MGTFFFLKLLSSFACRSVFRQTEQDIKDCSGGGQVLQSLLWQRMNCDKRIEWEKKWIRLELTLFILSLLPFFSPLPVFYSFSPLPSSIHCRLMHLTNHWAGKGINSYSKQRAIMGTLVVRKLRIFKPAQWYSGITERLYTLFSKHSLGQAWKERGGRDFNWQDKARRSVCLCVHLFPGCIGIGFCFWNSSTTKA